MKVTVIKYHLILFEVISLLGTAWILGSVLINTLLFRFNSGAKTHNQLIGLITYDIISTSNDIQIFAKNIEFKEQNIDLKPLTDNNKGYAILNKEYLDPQKFSSSEILEKLNNADLSKCFFFQDSPPISSAKGILSDLRSNSTDFWNLAIFLFLIVFFIFLKANMFRLNRSTIKNLKKHSVIPLLFKKRFIYSYVILHLTLMLIIPYLYKDFYDYKIEEYFGFPDNYFNSFFFDRTFLYNDQQERLDILSKFLPKNEALSKKLEYKDSLFFLYSPFFLKETQSSNSYMIYILFLCIMVWVSGLFIKNVLDYNSIPNEDENDNESAIHTGIRTKKTVCKKFIGLIWSGILLLTWIIFFLFGLANFIDISNFYHRLIFHNPIKLFNYKILSFIIVSYTHIYLYLFLIYYTCHSEIILKKTAMMNKKKNKDSLKTTENDLLINVNSNIKQNSPEHLEDINEGPGNGIGNLIVN